MSAGVDAGRWVAIVAAMNPIQAILWFWAALRGHSVTFGVFFALGVIGVSVVRLIKDAVHDTGAPWFVVIIVPMLISAALSKREALWIPDETKRRRIARSLIFGSMAVAMLLSWLRPEKPDVSDPQIPAAQSPGE